MIAADGLRVVALLLVWPLCTAPPIPMLAQSGQAIPPRPEAGEIRLTLDKRSPGPITLTRHRDGQPPEVVPVAVKSGPSPGETTLLFTCVAGTYVVHTAELVSTPVLLKPGACALNGLALFPSGRLTGQIVLASGAVPIPGAISIEARRCDDPDGSARPWRYSAAVANDSSFVTSLPTGCWDLILAMPHMAPVRLPRLAVAFRQSTHTGTVSVRPGATLTVQVTSRAQAPAAGVRLSVVPLPQVADLFGAPGEAGRRVPQTQQTDARGLASFSGLAPVEVCIAARADKQSGFAGPVALEAGSETSPPPVRLSSGSRVTFRAVAAGDWRTVDDRISVLAYPKVCGRSIRSAGLSADVDAAMDLPFAGQWRFSLRVDEGGRITVLDEQEMTVEDGLESAVAFRVERTVFEGRALVQGRPEFGSLTLVRQGPLGQVAAQTSVDADGHFKVRLPTAGKYQAAFRSGLTSTVHFSTDAEFIAGRPTTVDFRDVVLQGMVVRRDGVPASGAIVRATPAQFAEAMMAASLPTSTKTDDRGQFAFRVPPGTWVVRAALNALVASPLTVEVPASGAPPPLRIVLETTAPIRGRVVDAGGAPIPQAVGRVTLETSGDAQLSQSSLLQTDLDGYFTVDLDRPNPRGVQIVIASPGRPLTAFRLPSLPEEAPVLVVPATGAPVRLTLPLDSPVNANEPPPYRVYGLVNDQGAALTVVDILVFAKGSAVAAENAVTISVPAVAPGTWRLVKFRDDRDYDLWLAGLSPLNVLRTFSVSSAAPVVIDLTIR